LVFLVLSFLLASPHALLVYRNFSIPGTKYLYEEPPDIILKKRLIELKQQNTSVEFYFQITLFGNK
jgi:hypothetical protein